MNVFVTGAAGFIGANLVMRLLKTEKDINIVGLDSLNNYYDESLKEYRLKQIVELAKVPELVEGPTISHWTFIKGNLADKALIDSLTYPK